MIMIRPAKTKTRYSSDIGIPLFSWKPTDFNFSKCRSTTPPTRFESCRSTKFFIILLAFALSAILFIKHASYHSCLRLFTKSLTMQEPSSPLVNSNADSTEPCSSQTDFGVSSLKSSYQPGNR